MTCCVAILGLYVDIGLQSVYCPTINKQKGKRHSTYLQTKNQRRSLARFVRSTCLMVCGMFFYIDNFRYRMHKKAPESIKRIKRNISWRLSRLRVKVYWTFGHIQSYRESSQANI
ncbi:hypothetical protein CLU79DRAFT_767783 [Phycomyces nitens]|nr:hypothetical protein CLU79DRAFT_767783 [Phycomyces nitens]